MDALTWTDPTRFALTADLVARSGLNVADLVQARVDAMLQFAARRALAPIKIGTSATDETIVIQDGRHRLAAAVQLGEEFVAVAVDEDDHYLPMLLTLVD